MVNFDHSQVQRIKPVLGKYGREVLLTFDYKDDHGAKYREERPMTWMDLFFFAIQLYKHNLRAVLTRYPVTDKDSNLFVKPVVSTFVEDYGDCDIFLDHDDEEPIYSFKDEYPNISKFIKSPNLLDKAFDETMRISNLYLSGIGGDYDKISLS